MANRKTGRGGADTASRHMMFEQAKQDLIDDLEARIAGVTLDILAGPSEKDRRIKRLRDEYAGHIEQLRREHFAVAE